MRRAAHVPCRRSDTDMRITDFPLRWRIVALLFFLSVINYLDRQTLSVLASTLRTQLGISTAEYSYIVAAFLIAYTIGYLFCGAVIDRLGVRLSIIVALSVWSFAGLMHAFATGWISLALCRFALGLGESFNSPAGMKAIVAWIPQRERGLCSAIFSNGYIVGAMLAPTIVSFVALRFGWQASFVVTAALGLVYLVVWNRAYAEPEQHPRLAPAELNHILQERGPAEKSVRMSLLEIASHPAVLGFFLARLLTDSLSFFLTFWLPEYLQSSRGFSLAMIGMFAWIPFLASDIGGPGGGAISDWLVRRGWRSTDARKRLMLAAACVMPLSVVAVHASSAYVALALIAAILAAQSCWIANLLALMSEIFPRERLATFVSFCSVGGALGGIVSTLLAGQIIHATGYVPVFTTLGFLHLVAYGLIRIFSRRTAG